MEKKSVSFNDTPQVHVYEEPTAKGVDEIIAVAGHLHLKKSDTHFRDMISSQQQKPEKESKATSNMKNSVSWENWESFVSQPDDLTPQMGRIKA